MKKRYLILPILLLGILLFVFWPRSSDFDPLEDATIFDSVFLNDCYFVGFRPLDNPDELGVAVYLSTEDGADLAQSRILECYRQNRTSTQAGPTHIPLERAMDCYVQYINVQDRDHNMHSYFVVVSDNPDISELRIKVGSKAEEKIEIDGPSVRVVELPGAAQQQPLQYYGFYDFEGNEVR